MDVGSGTGEGGRGAQIAADEPGHELRLQTLGERVVDAYCSCGAPISLHGATHDREAMARADHAFHLRDVASTVEARDRAIARIDAMRGRP